jgi:hypothetical protein
MVAEAAIRENTPHFKQKGVEVLARENTTYDDRYPTSAVEGTDQGFAKGRSSTVGACKKIQALPASQGGMVILIRLQLAF